MANRLAEYEQARSVQGSLWPARARSQNMQQQLDGFMNQAKRWIVDHPELALTTAIVTGVVLGWLIKRR